jgi:hypothetical protein
MELAKRYISPEEFEASTQWKIAAYDKLIADLHQGFSTINGVMFFDYTALGLASQNFTMLAKKLAELTLFAALAVDWWTFLEAQLQYRDTAFTETEMRDWIWTKSNLPTIAIEASDG